MLLNTNRDPRQGRKEGGGETWASPKYTLIDEKERDNNQDDFLL